MRQLVLVPFLLHSGTIIGFFHIKTNLIEFGL
jgi:hypothetical protein